MRWRTAHNHRRSAERAYRKRFAVAKKTARLGMSYGMSLRRMADSLKNLSITTKDAEEAVRSFRRVYRRGQKWHRIVTDRMAQKMKNHKGQTPQEAVDSLTQRDRNRLATTANGRVFQGSTGFSSRGITESGSVSLTEFGKACARLVYRI